MKRKDKCTMISSTILCFTFFVLAVVLNKIGGSNADTYVLLYVCAVLLNIVLNLGLNAETVSINGAKKLVSLGKWMMPITGLAY